MKNRLVRSFVVATTVASALAAGSVQAQAASLTRDQVRAELVELHAAGYDGARGEDVSYPSALQAAEQRVAANQLAANTASVASGYGGSPDGSSAAGGRHHHFVVDGDGMKPVYFGQ